MCTYFYYISNGSQTVRSGEKGGGSNYLTLCKSESYIMQTGVVAYTPPPNKYSNITNIPKTLYKYSITHYTYQYSPTNFPFGHFTTLFPSFTFSLLRNFNPNYLLFHHFCSTLNISYYY